MAKTNLLEYVRSVRQEIGRITWPTRRETAITTAMVLIMVVLVSLFFLGVDAVLHWVVEWTLIPGA